jgi:hypothetical protein
MVVILPRPPPRRTQSRADTARIDRRIGWDAVAGRAPAAARALLGAIEQAQLGQAST